MARALWLPPTINLMDYLTSGTILALLPTKEEIGMNILVTGASGRLGKYLVPLFTDHDLLLMDVVPPPVDRAHVPFMKGDLLSIEDCRKAMKECDPEVILALGAISWATDWDWQRERVAARGERPVWPRDTTMRVNVLGLYYLMRAAVEAGVRAVIHTGSIVSVASSRNAYRYLPVDDRHPGCVTTSYDYSKMAGELMLEWFTRTHGIQTIVPRPAGNRTPEWLERYAKEVQPATEWDNHLWHYCDTRDVAWAHRLMFDALDRLLPHDCFLIHAADHRAKEDSRELVEKFRPDLIDSIPVYLQGRQAFVSCQKAFNAFGYRARYSWTDNL